MEKKFEDYFMELQTDMIEVCLEYINNKGNEIYIYCSYEEKSYYVGYFYMINGKILTGGKVNNELSEINVSTERQFQVLDILVEDLKKIKEICEQYGQSMPTEMKLVYNIETNAFDANYKYENIYSDDPEKVPMDAENEWFEEMKNKNIYSVYKKGKHKF